MIQIDEATCELLRFLDSHYQEAMNRHLELRPVYPDIEVGGEHMDPFFVAEAIRECMGALRRGATVEDAIKEGETASTAAVKIWNSRRGFQVHRWENTAHARLFGLVNLFLRVQNERQSNMATKTLTKSPARSSGKLAPQTTARATAKAPAADQAKAPGKTSAKAGRQATVKAVGDLDQWRDTFGKKPTETAHVPAGAKFLGVRDIPLDQIVIAPGNPRVEFDPVEIEQMGQSILDIGQLEPGCVYPLANGEGYALFVGEKRYRACTLKKIPTYRASVFDVSPQMLIEMRGIENVFRSDFNAIEKAEWMRQMLDECGYTQAALAAKLKMSPGEVSNTVRLLKLPDVWRKRVVSREIMPHEARSLVPWLEVKGILDIVDKAYKIEAKRDGGTVRDFNYFLRRILCQNSYSLTENYHWDSASGSSFYVNLKPDEDQKRLLDVRDVPTLGKESEPRAFNKSVWTLMVEAEKKRLIAANAAKKQKAEKKTGNKKPTAEDLKKKDGDYQKRLYMYKLRWTQAAIARRTEHLTESDLLRWLLATSVIYGQRDDARFADLKQLAPDLGTEHFKGKGYALPGERWDWILDFDDGILFPLLRELVNKWCEHSVDAYHTDANATAIEAMATNLGIDVETDWKVDEEFLNMHTIDQLSALERQWGLQAPVTSKSGKITAILSAATTKTLAAPEALVNVKPCRI